MTAIVAEVQEAPNPLAAPPEVLVLLLTRCGCTRVLGPAQVDKLPDTIEVKLLSVPGSLIEPGREEEARRFRLMAHGGDLLKQMGMVLQGEGAAIPQAVYLEVLTRGVNKLVVPSGYERGPRGPGT